MTINERLEQYLKANKIAGTEIYKKIGVSQPVFAGWLKQGRAIPLKKLQDILILYPNLNARWLLTGDGQMKDEKQVYPENSKINVIEECSNHQNFLAEYKEIITAKDETIITQKGYIKLLTEMLGHDLIPDDPANRKPKKANIKGFRGLQTHKVEMILNRILNDINVK